MKPIHSLLNFPDSPPSPPSAVEDAPASLTPSHLCSEPSATETRTKPTPTHGNGSVKPMMNSAPTKQAGHKSAGVSRNAPAAGASGGRAPLPATYFGPRFIHFDAPELDVLMNQLRDPLCTQLYMLIVGHSVFTTGEFLGGYARLMELCTPPQPERGLRRPSPSMKVMRRSIDDLVRFGLLERGERNMAQGHLRLWVTKLPFKNISTSTH